MFGVQIINALKEENNVINTKLRRVEGDNILKVRNVKMLSLIANSKGEEFPKGQTQTNMCLIKSNINHSVF